MRWTWDSRKDRGNRRAHGLDFETAALVFDDPLATSRLDDTTEEERWQTVGKIGGVIVFVVHTWPEPDGRGEVIGRIISARKANCA
ncbi:MAG: BrnT family toxin [Rhizomicrobium sp.]